MVDPIPMVDPLPMVGPGTHGIPYYTHGGTHTDGGTHTHGEPQPGQSPLCIDKLPSTPFHRATTSHFKLKVFCTNLSSSNIAMIAMIVGPLPPMLDMTAWVYQHVHVIITRLPRQLPAYLNLALPFSWDIWVIILGE